MFSHHPRLSLFFRIRRRCYLFHVTAFSLVGQLRIQRAELLNYRELYEDRVSQRDEAGELPGPEEVRAWVCVSAPNTHTRALMVYSKQAHTHNHIES